VNRFRSVFLFPGAPANIPMLQNDPHQKHYLLLLASVEALANTRPNTLHCCDLFTTFFVHICVSCASEAACRCACLSATPALVHRACLVLALAYLILCPPPTLTAQAPANSSDHRITCASSLKLNTIYWQRVGDKWGTIRAAAGAIIERVPAAAVCGTGGALGTDGEAYMRSDKGLAAYYARTELLLIDIL